MTMVKAEAWTRTVRLASFRAFTMASVQFPPGVKYTVTEEGVVVTLGIGVDCAGTGLGVDAIRSFPARQYWLSGH